MIYCWLKKIQDADVPPFSSDYNIDNLIDRYRNMRMDIDHMTYEVREIK